MSLTPIKEALTPESDIQSINSDAPGAPSAIADISDQSEPISNEVYSDSIPSESQPAESENVVTNEPMLPITAFSSTNKFPEHLKKAINFRKTLKHKKRAAYDVLTDSEKIETKKKLVDNFIHVLRASTYKSIYKSHRNSIIKLRHTLNKHLDYLETKKRIKHSKKKRDKI